MATSLVMALTAATAIGEGTWLWPVDGPVLTQYRNDNSQPYAGGMHRGIDIGAAIGTPVAAAVGGQVTFAGALGNSGLTVAVKDDDGHTVTSYLHLASVEVNRGDAVTAGSRLGTVGTTGSRSVDAPHLHFGVHRADEPNFYFDPLDFLGAHSNPAAATAPALSVAAVAGAPAALAKDPPAEQHAQIQTPLHTPAAAVSTPEVELVESASTRSANQHSATPVESKEQPKSSPMPLPIKNTAEQTRDHSPQSQPDTTPQAAAPNQMSVGSKRHRWRISPVPVVAALMLLFAIVGVPLRWLSDLRLRALGSNPVVGSASSKRTYEMGEIRLQECPTPEPPTPQLAGPVTGGSHPLRCSSSSGIRPTRATRSRELLSYAVICR